LPRSLVMLAGMMCDERLFAHQLNHFLQDDDTDIDILIPPMDTASTIERLAQNVLAASPPTFAVCGLSMGGILAMELYRQAPHRITHLALMDTNPLAETEQGVNRRNRQIADVQAGRLVQVMADEMKPLYLASRPDTQPLLKLCMDMAVSLGEKVFIAQSLALRDRRDQTETLKSVSCPTLILHGAEDKLCPPERHQFMHALIGHAELVSIEHAGHLPPLEMPDDVTAHLYQWLGLC